MAIAQYLKILLVGRDLDKDQAKELQDIIFSGSVSEVQVAAFLTAMAAKGQTPTITTTTMSSTSVKAFLTL